jgi:tRNA (guanine-N7-)-methyltransferase
MSDGEPPHPAMRSYGRVKARPIKPRQEALLERLLPKLAIPEGAISAGDLAAWGGETWFEIGFGGGEHTAAQAERHPGVVILGAEPFLNGVASALRHIDDRGLTNVRLRLGDARQLLADLPDASLARVFILFPDPWPKTRHKKRRLIQPDTVAELARVLRPSGRLRFATDWADYAAWTLQRLTAAPGFRWTAERADDWRTPPADHVTTRYETKGLGDCAPVFLEFERV